MQKLSYRAWAIQKDGKFALDKDGHPYLFMSKFEVYRMSGETVVPVVVTISVDDSPAAEGG
jgi:hypothetical protein